MMTALGGVFSLISSANFMPDASNISYLAERKVILATSSAPESCQQQCHDRRRSEPPVKEDFDVVPDPRRELHEVWDDEAERERQIEKQHAFAHEIPVRLEQHRGHNQRNEEAGILQPEHDGVFFSVVPS